MTSEANLLKWAKNAGVFALLSVATFYAFVFAVALAPILVPTRIFGSPGVVLYFVVLGLAAALAVGLVFGLICRGVFAENSLWWGLACSGSVALVYLGFAHAVRLDEAEAVWWASVLDAALLVAVFSVVSGVKWRKRSTDVT